MSKSQKYNVKQHRKCDNACSTYMTPKRFHTTPPPTAEIFDQTSRCCFSACQHHSTLFLQTTPTHYCDIAEKETTLFSARHEIKQPPTIPPPRRQTIIASINIIRPGQSHLQTTVFSCCNARALVPGTPVSPAPLQHLTRPPQRAG